MTIKIRPTEQTVLDAVGTDYNDINSNGIQVQPSTAYAATVYPISDYTTSVPPASATETKVKDGTKGMMAAMYRYVGPIFASESSTSPSFSFTTTTDLISKSFGEALEVNRTALVNVHFTASSSVANTRLDFWLDLNGAAQTTFKFYFNAASTHQTISASWVVPLTPGTTPVFTLKATRGSGTGTLSLNSDDFITLTMAG